MPYLSRFCYLILIAGILFFIPVKSNALSDAPIKEAYTLVKGLIIPADTIKPQFLGGESKLGEFIATRYNYPLKDLGENRSGYAFIYGTVSKSGKVKNFTVLKASQKNFSDNLKSVLALMPEWQPTRLNNKTLETGFIFPVLMQVNGKEDKKLKAEFDQYYNSVILRVKKSRELMYTMAPLTLTADGFPDPPKPPVFPDSLKKKDEIIGKRVYTFIEQPPQFPGGNEAMQEFIADKFKPTPEAIANNVHGQLEVWFVVEENGTLSDIYVPKKVGYGLDEEAVRVAKLFPKFKPGYQNKKAVAFLYKLPIKY